MPVTVNLNVNVDASGNIEVFGAGPDTTDLNQVVATYLLPVNALYDDTKNVVNGVTYGAGLIEFWEPSADMGNIYAKLANGTGTGSAAFNVDGVPSYKVTSKVLAAGLHRVFVDELNASTASPFSAEKYSGANADNYRKCSDFGRLALSTYAHYLFGHVDATAAITNDEAFMSKMLSLTDGTTSVKDGATAAQRYAAWKTDSKAEVTTSDVDSWVVGTPADAKLAVGLVKAILAKATTTPLSATRATTAATTAGATYGSDTLANIVKQVIGQDASRAMDQDNNEFAPEIHQILRFESGDSIYLSITLAEPTVSVSSGPSTDNAGKPAVSKYDKEVAPGVQKEKYDIKITLGPRKELVAIA